MKRYFSYIDGAYSLATIIVLLAYFEVFGDVGSLYYLIHTPYYLVLLPTLAFTTYRIVSNKPVLLTVTLFLISSVYISFFAGQNLESKPQTTEQQTPIRVCSWNTAYFFTWGEQEGYSRLAKEDCTFILLQETWKSENQQDKLWEVNKTYFPTMRFFSQGEFVIFAPSNEVSAVTYSATDAFLLLDTVHNGQALHLYSMHLWTPISNKPKVTNNVISYKPPQTARREQKKDLLAQLELSNRDSTTLIIGDFNTMQNGKILRDLTHLKNLHLALISQTITRNRNTFTSNHPLIQIDYAFVSKGKIGGAKLRTSCVYSASDHCLLIVDVVL